MNKYWIFRADPCSYFIVDYWLKHHIRNHPTEVDWWEARKGWEYGFSKNDIAYVWKTTTEPSRGLSSAYDAWKAQTGWKNQGDGVYAVGSVQGEAKHDEITMSQMLRFAPYYVDLKRATGQKWRVYFNYPHYHWNRVDHPLLRKNIEGDPILSRVRNDGWGLNHGMYSLELEEGREFWRLIFGNHSPPPI